MSQQALTKEQKQAVGLLSIGTFLEYFDLMLYIHMAVVLNDLFFSKTDPFSSSLLGSFSFCTVFLFRPVGALLIGYLGDKYGRKPTVIITSVAMAISCIWIALLPTYAQIGVSASIAITLCRMIQGFSSMGEKVGAEIYLTELIKPPKVYPSVAFTNVFAGVGGSAALFVANLSLSHDFNWRMAFWMGATVAFVGIFARKCLRETADFADAKRHTINIGKDLNISKEEIVSKPWFDEKINKKTALSLFFIQLTCPTYMYFVYVHCANILKNTFHYSSANIIQHNLIVSLIELAAVVFITYLLYFFHPLKILKVRYYITVPFILIVPLLLNKVTGGFELMLIQIFIVIFMPTEFTACPIFYKAFPTFKRFTSVCLIFAISRALMYVISSFGLVLLTERFGNYGVSCLLIPVITLYGYGLFYFINRENTTQRGLVNDTL